jgi:hypothetical protein
MSPLPPYLWVITVAGVVGVLAATCVVLYGGARRAGSGRRRSRAIVLGAAVVLGLWLVASTIIAGAHGYQARLGHQIPWMPIAVLGFFLLLLALSGIPAVSRALNGPEMNSRLLLPHLFRAAGGFVFLVAMVMGLLPALFAIPAGVGDLAIGIAAPFVARRIRRSGNARGAMSFTVLGIVDLVVALTLGALVGFQLLPFIPPAPAISSLPLVLIPTVAVPLLLVLHIRSLSLLRARETSPVSVG